MNAAKRKTQADSDSTSASGAVASRGRRLLLGSIGLIVAFGGGSIYAWRQFGSRFTQAPAYQLSAEDLEITAPPPWIRSDLKGEVVRDGSLSELDLLDPQVTIQVARAFTLHPWVAGVTRVSKHHPARIVVELQYRRPVAMVEVRLDDEQGLKQGTLPVDSTGVLLPSQDFMEEVAGGFRAVPEARNYLRLAVGDSVPAGPEGTPWGDERVSGGAKLATLLEGDWQDLQLYRIVAIPAADGMRRQAAEPSYELLTRQGSRILWGRAPGREKSGEPAAASKLARLLQFVANHGPLDSLGTGMEIDLRQSDTSGTRRTANAAGSRNW